ncbi:MAG: hypothetical protein JNK43_04905, partial [Ignavibacteria bacterium]|nr:hypothetical protein [Ignavibacteria bacterium]
MRTGRNNIVFIGRYVDTEKLSGPEKFSKRIFENIASLLPAGNVSFIQYFFDGRKYSLREKISGFDGSDQNGLKVYRTGLYRFYRILRQLR